MSGTTQSSKIYLIAGATRGLGLALVEDIAEKDPNAIIYAGGRDPWASRLIELEAKYVGRVELAKYVAADKEINDALAEQIKKKHGRVDTVIANAGLMSYNAKIDQFPTESFNEHFTVNTFGPIVLFQSFYDLLKASPFPRFVTVSSAGGSIELLSRMWPHNHAGYSMSKAALNWVTRKIHYENEWLVAFPICPGAVDTDMAKQSIELDSSGLFGQEMQGLWRPPSVAAPAVMDIINTSTREKDGGQFHDEAGGRHPW